MKFWLASLALASCLTSTVQAQNAPLGTALTATTPTETKAAPRYQIELFVFSQNRNNTTAEHWKTLENFNISPNVQPLKNSGNLKLLANSQRSLPVSKRLMNKQGYRPLFHRVWQQSLQDKQKARPIRITGGKQIANDLFELDGEIKLDIARYLHLNTRLYFSVARPAGAQNSLQQLTPENATNSDSTPTNTSGPSTLPEYLTVSMQQGRRMRGGEIHYLDHPLFGLLIRLTRLEHATVEQKPASPNTNLSNTNLSNTKISSTTSPDTALLNATIHTNLARTLL